MKNFLFNIVFLITFYLLSTNYSYSQLDTNKRFLLGEIKNNSLELFSDDKILTKKIAEEIGNNTIINKIQIQKDENNSFYIFAEGKQKKYKLIVKIELKLDNGKLFVATNSIMEYCITEKNFKNLFFSFNGECECYTKKGLINIKPIIINGFTPNKKGIGELFK